MNEKIYDNEIEMLIDEYCEKYNIVDLSQETQNRFDGCMKYCGSKLFKGTGILKDKSNQYYDIDKVYELYEIYENIVFSYGKVVSILGFSFFSGVDMDVLYYWLNSNNIDVYRDGTQCILSSKHHELTKRIISTREKCLEGTLISGKGSPVGVIAILNKKYGWNNADNTSDNTSTRALSVADLPKLGCKD